ncbi:MAG: hypothetical protein AAF351_02495 [Pseudomonadota bacterium]
MGFGRDTSAYWSGPEVYPKIAQWNARIAEITSKFNLFSDYAVFIYCDHQPTNKDLPQASEKKEKILVWPTNDVWEYGPDSARMKTFVTKKQQQVTNLDRCC